MADILRSPLYKEMMKDHADRLSKSFASNGIEETEASDGVSKGFGSNGVEETEASPLVDDTAAEMPEWAPKAVDTVNPVDACHSLHEPVYACMSPLTPA